MNNTKEIDLLGSLIINDDSVMIQEDETRYFITSENTIKVYKINGNLNVTQDNLRYLITKKYGKIDVEYGVNLSCILTGEEKLDLEGMEK